MSAANGFMKMVFLIICWMRPSIIPLFLKSPLRITSAAKQRLLIGLFSGYLREAM